MTIKITQGLEPDWFTPESQKDEDSPAEFKIEPMTSVEFMAFSAASNYGQDAEGKMTFSTDERGFNMALKKVKSWKNIEDDKGDPLPFNPVNLRKLPVTILSEIINKVLEISTLSQENEKN